MKIPFFASFIVFCVWLTYELAKHNRLDEAVKNAFWEKERRANKTERKSLENLPYITIPFDELPVHALEEDERIGEYLETLRTISDSPIVNFTGISNTDLKLQYGAPNIDLLTKYDQNYTVLARTLNQWASRLYENGLRKEALTVLEFAVSTRTDVSGTYKLLCRIYREDNTPEKIEALYPVVESLNSVMKKPIFRILQEAD